ncbi:MAG: ABC transporter permease [Spirochaetales bacterium]|nr:ABC transporter permease [Spirochaetales bacterium]
MAQARNATVSTAGGVARTLAAVWNYLRDNIAVLALIIVVIVFSVANPNFFTLANFANIGRQVAMIAIMACGMTMVIVSANIDLSVASTLSFAAMITGLVVEATGSTLLGLLVGLAIGVGVGFVNGMLVTKGRIPSFLATLGMMGVVRGAAMMVTGTKPVVIYTESYWRAFGDGQVFGVLPVAIFWTIVTLIIAHIILSYTSLGRYIYATGGNKEAARFTGIKTDRTIIIAFIIMGLLAAFAGVILSSRMHASRPGTGEGMELNVIAAVILGGTSLFGGKGTIFGSLVGALVIGALNNGLIILGFSTHVQMLVRGLVIILAVLFAREEKT